MDISKASNFERFIYDLVGRDGADLRARWRDDAHAYLGVTVPDFPNLFCLYGPNTNLVANGSIIFFTECEVNHLVDAVRVMLEAGARSIDPLPSVLDAYIAEIDAGLLTDDLPFNAYLDNNFEAWLKRSSQQQ